MKKSASLILLALFTLAAQADNQTPARIDLLKVQDIAIEVAPEVDHGYSCVIYRWSGGRGIQADELEGHCPKDIKETFGKAWARNIL